MCPHAKEKVHTFGLVISILKWHGFDINEVSLLLDKKPGILALQETWNYAITEFTNYNLIHVSAVDPNTVIKGRPHGGLGMYIRDDIPFKCISKSCNHISFLAANKVNVHNMYLPSNDTKLTVQRNHELLTSALSIAEKETCDEIFIGDFNTDPKDISKRQDILKKNLE